MSAEGVTLEIDDIQSGVLHERPNPYVGTHLLLRIDDPAAGRQLLRRLLPVVDRCEARALPTRLSVRVRQVLLPGVPGGDGRSGRHPRRGRSE